MNDKTEWYHMPDRIRINVLAEEVMEWHKEIYIDGVLFPPGKHCWFNNHNVPVEYAGDEYYFEESGKHDYGWNPLVNLLHTWMLVEHISFKGLKLTFGEADRPDMRGKWLSYFDSSSLTTEVSSHKSETESLCLSCIRAARMLNKLKK